MTVFPTAPVADAVAGPAARSAVRRPVPAAATVVRTRRLSPTMVRVVFEAPAGFAMNGSTDSYVKLIFPRAVYPQPLDLDRIKRELPVEQWPVVRTYSVRGFDPVTHELTVDFVVHGTAGVAGPATHCSSAAPAAPTPPTRRPTGTCSPATRAHSRRSPPRWRLCRPTPAGMP